MQTALDEKFRGYIDQIESYAQSILDITAEMHSEMGPRIPLTHPAWDCPVVPPNRERSRR